MTDRRTLLRRLLIRDRGGRECRYCSTWFLQHPGFADHQDVCPLNPMNRDHIIGTANAPGIDLDGEVLV